MKQTEFLPHGEEFLTAKDTTSYWWEQIAQSRG